MIGVGVDGTASGRDAVVLASPLGRSTGAELLLIAVVEESLVLLPGPDEVSWNTIQKQARTTLAKTRDSLAPQARVGVGFDGEPEARAALALAASIAKAAGADLEVLGVVDDRVPGRLTTGQVVLGGEAIVAGEVDSLVDRALAAVQAHDVSARVQVSAGNPSEALRSLAAEVDLLVIGSSRSGRAGRLSLGRTGERVTVGSPCPVMIVPRPRDDSSI